MDPALEYRRRTFGKRHFPNSARYDESVQDLAVTDFCCCKDSGAKQVSATRSTLHWNDIDNWIGQPHSCDTSGRCSEPLLRIFGIGVTQSGPRYQINGPRAQFERLLKHTGLTDAFELSSTDLYVHIESCFRNFRGIQCGLADARYSVCLIWIQESTSGVLQAIWLSRTPSNFDELQNIIVSFTKPALHHPLALSIVWCVKMQEKLLGDRVFWALDSMENATGYSEFANKGPRSVLSEADLRALSAKVFGLKAVTASLRLTTKVVKEVLQATRKAITGSADLPLASTSDQTEAELLSWIVMVEQTLFSYELRLDDATVGIEAQMTAVRPSTIYSPRKLTWARMSFISSPSKTRYNPSVLQKVQQP